MVLTADSYLSCMVLIVLVILIYLIYNKTIIVSKKKEVSK